ncbi:MgtC/SapB transporter [Alkaliphilus metalliredigens QYMF]|uniref:MgtC/SapB transporter n=1 Tax=Alkaliphilus metalliredigens (strain QYMF) TaxID=293826 RepID=A6TMJ5_ALKMQ|nr:MgtC/SapB family protein [Alkaliphilus metalliredigens]ABR47413.1 MgtC/SapB transporter [Alkaliphilus metalliredigens QYMF]
MLSTQEVAGRLLLAVVLGGLIGVERESVRRGAGFRTHILVCIGSTLVMLISIFIFETYRHQANLDPARLGAQVISGIGFLGAGTIIKEGFSIKGLTTAASLWAIASIGLALGIGFYSGAIMSTLIIYIALKVFPMLEWLIPDQRKYLAIELLLINQPGQIGKITDLLGKNGISITNISMDMDTDESETAILTLQLKKNTFQSKEDVVKLLSDNREIKGLKIL